MDKQQIFEKLKALLKEYDGRLTATRDSADGYELYSIKDIEAFGRKYDKMYFAAALIKKNYVGFYYMPIYAEPEKVTKFFKPELLKLLKGKSCFHIKKYDQEIFRQIEDVLKKGFEAYKEKGWVD
jgi:hypothetical protein